VTTGIGQNARKNPRQISRANHVLDAANFFLADVRDALGPYLAIYLLTERKWDAASIGVVMSVATIAGSLAQTPAGALVDVIKAKRAFMIAAAVAVTAASLILPWLSSFWPVAISQATAHAAGVVFGPALAAVTLGIVGHQAFTRRIGRNETFNHAGNAFAAAASGVLAYLWGPTVVFYLLAAMSVASIVSVSAIPERAIDHELARGLRDAPPDRGKTGDAPSGPRVLLTCRPLLIFAGCAIMFHFAVQLLDGVGAGIYGAIFPVIVADLMRGTGRFNVAQGAVITAQGIGAALSTSVAGFIVVHAGYSAAFLTLAGVAAAGLALYCFVMPETQARESAKASRTRTALAAE
jgi:sugar phosphate permease